MQVKDFLSRKGRKGDLGLELEVEADISLPTFNDSMWMTHREGSLRGVAAEYVTPGPVTLAEAGKAIRTLCWELNLKKHGVIYDSPRTSFHVHRNLLSATATQYWNHVVLYWLVEDVLLNYATEYRKGNSFCLRLKDAEDVIKTVIQDLKGKTPFRAFQENTIRYAGLNLEATRKYGTLEFRGMDGRPDASRLETWVTQLYRLGDYAMKQKSPAAILDDYFNTPAATFLGRFLDESFQKEVCKPGWRDSMLEAAATLSEIAYYHDWEAWEKKLTEPSSSQKAFDQAMAQALGTER